MVVVSLNFLYNRREKHRKMNSNEDENLVMINALRFKAFELEKKCDDLIRKLHTFTDSENKRKVMKSITEMKIEASLLNDDTDKMIAEMKSK